MSIALVPVLKNVRSEENSENMRCFQIDRSEEYANRLRNIFEGVRYEEYVD